MLSAIRDWYDIFNDNLLGNVTIPLKCEKLNEISNYFLFLSKNCKRNILGFTRGPQSWKNIERVYEKCPWSANSNSHSLAYFGTNINENLFSQFRAKQRYLTVLSVYMIDLRAYAELVKRNCIDLPFHYPSSDLSKCYNNQTALKFLMEDIPFLSQAKISMPISATQFDEELKNIVLINHPTRRQMTLRIGTCFENPYGAEPISRGKISCPFAFHTSLNEIQTKICNHAPYQIRTALKTHLKSKHKIFDENELQVWMAKAELLSIQGEGEIQPNEDLILKDVQETVDLIYSWKDPIIASCNKIFDLEKEAIFFVDWETTGFEATRQG